MSKVALVRCEHYSTAEVQAAVDRGISLLGGINSFASSGEKILIKPNILSGESPEKNISPHPEVFRAVARAFAAAGAALSFGDSPGFGNPKSNAQRGGFMTVAEEEGVAWAEFTAARAMPFPDGHIIKKFFIAEGVADCDGLVSLSKLKPHGLTRMTGAIKNQFGCIPGARKAEYHSVLPNASMFSQMLIDLNMLLKPRLFIMDAIIALEGYGPRNGSPRLMKLLLFSSDPVALDATACKIINLDPKYVEPLIYGEEFGLGTATDIDLAGDPIDDFITPDFVVNRSPQKTSPGGSFLDTSFLRRFSAPRPTINADICAKCGRCVEVCPAQPKALSWTKAGKTAPPVYDYAKCIRCYCCQEMCPFDAIYIKVPALGKLIRK